MSVWKSTARRAAALVPLLVLPPAALVGVGCAGRHSAPAAGNDRNTITAAEIEATSAATAYDLIRKLRPQYLVGRGALTLDPRRGSSTDVGSSSPRVYVDDQLYGDVTTLRGIVTGTIQSVHFLTGSAAQQKYGHDNAAGVIAIATKH